MLGGVWHAVENFEGSQLQSMLPRVVIERDPVVASVCVCVCVCVCVAILKLPKKFSLVPQQFETGTCVVASKVSLLQQSTSDILHLCCRLAHLKLVRRMSATCSCPSS